MNSKQILFSAALGFFALSLSAQEKSKTYKETFNVSDDAVLEINTSHADIEFETWEKNQVEITALIELDGASDEEAEKYFENMNFEIKGNSREIEITTGIENTWFFKHSTGGLNEDFNFNFNHSPKLELLFEDLEMPELPELAVLPDMPEMPPMPPIGFSFDYEEFKKDGDEYMKKWKKDFDKSFDKDYQKRIEEWGKRMEERAKEWEERNAERLERMEKRAEERAERMEERARVMEERREAAEERRDAIRKSYDRNLIISRDDEEAPSIFYFLSDGENKKYKVKKSIKVKMPKSVKLKMNVRHGEVKLAGTTNNINASLRYASLLASTIDGSATDISASYSPVIVQKWNHGQLKTDYSDKVKLKEVGILRLNSTSSNVVIDQLTKKAYLKNNLGALTINSISNTFSDMDILVKNGEVRCKIPSSAFLVEVDKIYSDLKYPETLILNRSEGFRSTMYSGYHKNEQSPKSIKIDSYYSDVVLED